MINVALIGLGNCAWSLLQLVESSVGKGDRVQGVMNQVIGGYRVEDVNVVAAFDVNAEKVGRSLSEAVKAAPNCTTEYFGIANSTKVSPGILKDGLSEDMKDVIDVHESCQFASEDDVRKVLVDNRVHVVVNFLPVGSKQDTENYALIAARCGCAFVNCNPELVANNPEIEAVFLKHGVPVLGDDIKSQLGATMLHRSICQSLIARGATVERTYQINVGGNSDFRNMVDRTRSRSKKKTKSGAIEELFDHPVEVNVGPSDFLPLLNDRKVAYIRIEGTSCLGMKFNIETRLDVEDSPNSAGVSIDGIRCAKVALDKGLAGAVEEPCSFLFKCPPHSVEESLGKDRLVAWAES